MKRKKRNFFVEQYSKSWDYINESKNYIFIIIAIFVLFFLFAFFVSPSQDIQNSLMTFLQELLEKTKDYNQLEMTLFLFFNNLQSSFFGFIFGLLFGIFPILSAIINGYVVGFVSALSVESSGILSLLSLLPHGIFELPAVFISLGMGLRFGTFIFKKNIKKYFIYFFSNGLRVFIFVVIPLLFIAAIIEGALIFLIR